jgi:ornithine cyclodeaminase/alanine dehydrogenase-like protein (mu-crystallin family)/O-acetyl-ADP-ribose deacetylase (regulator of RNase III)
VDGSITGVRLEVIDGDIAALVVDAVVNAANDHLWMGAGVAGALKRAGGPEVERDAVAKGPIAIGDAVATTAGRLPARWVIHAAVMGQDLRTSAELIVRATLSTLRVADELGAASVALPAFGTGVGGFSMEECARLMVGACADYLRAHPQTRIGRIVFATYGAAGGGGRGAGGAGRAPPHRPPITKATGGDGLVQDFLYLSRDDVRSLKMPPGEVVDVLLAAFRAKGEGHAVMPPKMTVHSSGDDFSQAMAAWIGDAADPASSGDSLGTDPRSFTSPSPGGVAGLGAKWVCLCPGNAALGLPTLNGLVVLSDPRTGVPLAVMDAAEVTAMRTGASAGLAARLLARPGAAVVGLLGCGVQGRSSLLSLAAELPELRQARLFDVRPQAAEALAGGLSSEMPGVEFVGCHEAAQVARDADVIVTAITHVAGAPPPLDAGLAEPGALAVALDYDAAWTSAAMAEFDRFVADDTAQVLATRAAGVRLGGIPAVHADLGELAAGRAPMRATRHERWFCLNLGVAIEDVAAGMLIYRHAVAAGLGMRLPL